ncbi:unnamed protein product [Caenorhabditis angaria]|uniref:Galectin n=1 Tax=Caenorhabditis angaria TaxID=860376 RepID=A0A9P1J1R0_9PELO|nr:unnamed protein product [Caenorhabditis angaria]
MASPILNPATPGSYALHSAVQSGLQINFAGQVDHKKKDFAINLVAGGNIALHINFRFEKTKTVAMNSQIGNGWGNEVRHDNPLHHDNTFELQVRVYPGYFHVTVNGILLADFPHRLPYESIQAISLDGHVHMKAITFTRFA